MLTVTRRIEKFPGRWARLKLTEQIKAYIKQVLKTKTRKFSESEEERLVGQNAVGINEKQYRKLRKPIATSFIL